MHNPESLEEIPIHSFKDVLKHICKKPVNETDEFRIRHLKFKYTTEKFLEVAAKVERKGRNGVTKVKMKPSGTQISRTRRLPPRGPSKRKRQES